MLSIRVMMFLLLLVFMLSSAAFAQFNDELASPSIIINLPSRTLELFSNNNLVKVYPIAIGKPSTPSPLGSFQIINKEINPVWIHPRTGNVVSSGPDNPLGYRWMEFSPLYGIHGTNAPWAIGLAVSNGCIRMHEEDAEELFEVASYGTPVQITYERVKVQFGGNGEVSMGIYPDIYGWHELSLHEVKNKLISYGVSDFLQDNELIELINEPPDGQMVIAKFHTLKVNGKILSEHAFTYKDMLYIPVKPVAAALDVTIIWDDQSELIRRDNRSVPGRIINNQLVVTGENARILFGGQQVWNVEDNRLELDALSVIFNNRLITRDVQLVDGILAIPVLSLADAINKKLILHSDGDYWLQGKKIPVSLVGEIPYIQITKIYDVFLVYVYWNQDSKSIELTYPIPSLSH